MTASSPVDPDAQNITMKTDKRTADDCIIPAGGSVIPVPQDDEYTKKKNLAINLGHVARRLCDIRECGLFADDPFVHCRFAPTVTGAVLILACRNETRAFPVCDCFVYNEELIDTLTLDIIKFLSPSLVTPLEPKIVLLCVKKYTHIREQKAEEAEKGGGEKGPHDFCTSI